MDVQFDVEKGKIVKGQVFSDCLVPVFIDSLNAELAKGETSYDVDGIKSLCAKVRAQSGDEASMAVVRDTYIP